MKKFLPTIILGLLLALPVSAQYHRNYGNNRYHSSQQRYNHGYMGSYGNVYYGLRLGLGISTVNSDNSALDGGNSSTGLNVGAIIGTQLSPYAPIFLESGLYYTEKGGEGTNNGQKFTYDLNYLEIPILAKYKYFINDDFAIQPFAGGYLAFGVGGKIKNYTAREVSDSFSDTYFKRFDGGLKLGCGLSFQNLYFDMGYDIGLANISHDIFDKSHNGCFYINIGVDF